MAVLEVQLFRCRKWQGGTAPAGCRLEFAGAKDLDPITAACHFQCLVILSCDRR